MKAHAISHGLIGLVGAMLASPTMAQTAQVERRPALSADVPDSVDRQTSPDDDAIVVVGDSGETFRLSADRLKSAVRVFDKFRPSLAP